MLKKLIIGTAQFGMNYGITNSEGKMNKDEIGRILNFCKSNNINTFDTAKDYGNAEDLLSEWQKENPNIKIITKAKSNFNYVTLTDKFKSLECFLFHSYGDYTPENVQKVKTNPKVHSIGISVYTVREAIHVLTDNIVDIIQIPFNYVDHQWFNTEFQNLLKLTKVKIHVRSIFLQGLLINRITPEKCPKNIEYTDFCALNNIIDEITEKVKLSRKQLCFAFINSFPWIDKFLIGIDNFDHLIDNYETIIEDLHLSQENIEYIRCKTQGINQYITSPLLWQL